MMKTQGIFNYLRGYCSMSLLIRINLALGAVFIAAALIAGYACRTILEANAQREVFDEAAPMTDRAFGMRSCTPNGSLPLLRGRTRAAIPPHRLAFHPAAPNSLPPLQRR